MNKQDLIENNSKNTLDLVRTPSFLSRLCPALCLFLSRLPLVQHALHALFLFLSRLSRVQHPTLSVPVTSRSGLACTPPASVTPRSGPMSRSVHVTDFSNQTISTLVELTPLQEKETQQLREQQDFCYISQNPPHVPPQREKELNLKARSFKSYPLRSRR